MRLDYNILWVEDNQQNVHAQRDRIESLIRKEGFRLQVKFCSSVDESTSFLSDHVHEDHIDLILMDYDLGAGKKGDEGLSEIRGTFPYKDIVFYSGLAAAELMKKANARDIQGVFTSHRDALPDIVVGVFENLVRKVLDIDHSRGIVMGATSEIDRVINNALTSLFDKCTDDQQKECLEKLALRIEEKHSEYEKSRAIIKAIAHLKELEQHYNIFTSDDRLRLLRKLLKILELHQKHDGKFDEYRGVLSRRNDLAHIRVKKNGFSRKLYGRDGKEITSDDMRALRVSLLELQELFDTHFGEIP